MSLKTFHIIFIIVCISLALFVAGWGVYNFGENAQSQYLIAAFLSFGAAVALGVYEYCFIKKINASL